MLSMLRKLFALFLLLIAVPFQNGASAQNIAHGVRVLVIDAGHGGKFPGAHYAGVYEKDLTLKVALKLGKLVEEQMPGVQVVYTRKSDKELGSTLLADLQKRADIANEAGGDLFLSIHINAAASTAARGVETLIMGETPKEQRYNEEALFESKREDLIDMSDERTAAIVRAYIQNLQFTYGDYSMAMARCIQQQYVKAGRHDRGIKPQLLRVLYATDMPGVLTEIGFLSNAQEAAYMKSEKGQNEIARSLFQAVKNYSAYVAKMQADSGAATATQQSLQRVPEAGVPDKAEAPAAGRSGYTIQVLASPERVPLRSAQFKEYKGKVKEYSAEGSSYRYKYCIGFYAERSDAQRQLKTVRRTFRDAFVVRCEGSRIVQK